MPASSSPERLPGWESRLAAVLAAARAQPYVLGEHDCFRLACAAVEALTGVDHWPRWAGTYRTPRQALARIVAFGGDFQRAFSRLFGGGLQPMARARRGDIALYVDAGAQSHLGVVVGAQVVVLGEQGVLALKRGQCVGCWRIG